METQAYGLTVKGGASQVKVARCSFNKNPEAGVYITDDDTLVEIHDCSMLDNGLNGIVISGAHVELSGRTHIHKNAAVGTMVAF